MNDTDEFCLEEGVCPWDETTMVYLGHPEQATPGREEYKCGQGHLWVKVDGVFQDPPVLARVVDPATLVRDFDGREVEARHE